MLSKTALHALRAVVTLAELPRGTWAGAGDVAATIDAPPNYLGKLLKSLADEGVLESQKGKGGGFRLARPASSISVFDVVEPIDHVSRWGGCFMGRSKCSDTKPCAVHVRWGAIRDQYLKFLKDTRLAELASQHNLPISLS